MQTHWAKTILMLLDRVGLSESALAVESGVSQASVNRYLRGDREPAMPMVMKMNEAMGRLTGTSPIVEISLDWFARVFDPRTTEGVSINRLVKLVPVILKYYEQRLVSNYVTIIEQHCAKWPSEKMLRLLDDLMDINLDRVNRMIDARPIRRSHFDEYMKTLKLAGIPVDRIKQPEPLQELIRIIEQIDYALADAFAIVCNAAVDEKRSGNLVRTRLEQERRVRDAVLKFTRLAFELGEKRK